MMEYIESWRHCRTDAHREQFSFNVELDYHDMARRGHRLDVIKEDSVGKLEYSIVAFNLSISKYITFYFKTEEDLTTFCLRYA